VLAKMASALDIISGGRLELGIGAGRNEEVSNAYGTPPTIGQRHTQVAGSQWSRDSTSVR